MNIERLKLMSDMLGEVAAGTWKPSVEVPMLTPEGRFNLDVWVCVAGECGYSACAVGHAMLDSRFAAQGLETLPFGSGGGSQPIYGLDDNWNAVDAFFGTGFPISRPLFSSDYYTDVTYGEGVDPARVKARVDFLLDLIAQPVEEVCGSKSFYERVLEAGL